MASWQPPTDHQHRPVVVLGAGVLGRRIAACWLSANYNVHIRDPSADQLQQAQEYIKTNIGVYTTITQKSSGELKVFVDLVPAIENAWLVIEAVPEKLGLKESTFVDLEKSAPEDCILATNSSSYKSSELVTKLRDETKKRALNTHYMMPPEALIVELMTDGVTDRDLIDWLFGRHQEAGLHPIVAQKESTGFVFNRIWAAIKRETLKVLEEGVSTPAEIDRVFKEMYGSRDGPCHMMDAVGLDTVSNIEEHYVKERGITRKHLDWLNENYVKPGKLGKKSTGKGGLYDVPKPGSQTQLIFLNLGVGEPLSDDLSFDQVLHRGSILKYNVEEAGKPIEIVAHEHMPDGIDVFEDRVYWTDMGTPPKNDGAVYSAKLDGSDIQAIIPPGKVHTPKQLIVEPQGKKIYFCDREGYRVMRANLDGSELETLVQTADWQKEQKDESYWCVGIAVSIKLNKIFWTQKGASKAGKGRIFSAGIDSPQDPANRNDVEVVLADLPEPIDLELDDEEGILYWTDRGELPLGNTLNKKTLVGDAPAAEKKLGRQILAQGFGEAIGLKLDKQKDCMWVADIAGHIWKCNPHRAALKEKVYEGPTSAFTGLTFIRM